MISWSTNRVNPAVAARTALPGTTRQSTATAPIASRGAQFRSAALSRSAATTIQRDGKIDDDEDDDKKPKKELLSREEDPNDDVLDNPDDNETDDEPDDDDKDNVIIVVS
jgi:hypothetical protein